MASGILGPFPSSREVGGGLRLPACWAIGVLELICPLLCYHLSWKSRDKHLMGARRAGGYLERAAWTHLCLLLAP